MLRKAILLMIRFYQLCISPHLPVSCKYIPSCSAYAYEAVTAHGVFKGVWLTCWRILRCNPFSKGGFDPVP